MIDTVFEPDEAPRPRVIGDGSTVRLGPDLLHNGQTITVTLLTDGPTTSLTPVNPLANVKLRQESPYLARRDGTGPRGRLGAGLIKKILTWSAVAFIIYYVATSPTQAADTIRSVGDWFQSAGNSLAKFLDNL